MKQEIIQKVLSGTASNAERDEFLRWFKKDGRPWLDEFIEQQWDSTHTITSDKEKEVFVNLVLDRVRRDSESDIKRKRSFPHRSIVYRIALGMAAACLIMSLGWWLSARSSHKELSQSPLAHIIRNNGPGKMKTVRLPDGTTVVLNAESTLQYSDDYNRQDRNVTLDGQAFFDVAHDPSKPFFVKTSKLTTKVYGTAFDIYAYKGSSECRVALQRGKVSFTTGSDHEERFLSPGQLLIYQKNSHTLTLANLPVSEIGNWLEGKLVFYHTPVQDVFDQLSVTYGVRFIQEKPITDKFLNATFDHASLDKVLQHLAFLWEFNYSVGSDTIHIK